MKGRQSLQVIESPLLPQPLPHLPAVPQQEPTVLLFQVDKERFPILVVSLSEEKN